MTLNLHFQLLHSRRLLLFSISYFGIFATSVHKGIFICFVCFINFVVFSVYLYYICFSKEREKKACADESVVDSIPLDQALSTCSAGYGPLWCSSAPVYKMVSPDVVFSSPTPVHLTSINLIITSSYLLNSFIMLHVPVFPSWNIVVTFQQTILVIFLGVVIDAFLPDY